MYLKNEYNKAVYIVNMAINIFYVADEG